MQRLDCNEAVGNKISNSSVFWKKRITYSEEEETLTKKTAGLLIALAILIFVFAACPGDSPQEENIRHPAWGSPPYTGTVSGEASGYHQNGPIKIIITLTLEDGYITTVSFDGSSGNTDGYGSRVIDSAIGKIVADNSVEIDVMTGASVTSTAVVNAGRDALGKIPAE
jgi:uncharacterized protein with FMN-binding domain